MIVVAMKWTGALSASDAAALETALRLDADVTAVTVGPPDADQGLRQALAAGATRASASTRRPTSAATRWHGRSRRAAPGRRGWCAATRRPIAAAARSRRSSPPSSASGRRSDSSPSNRPRTARSGSSGASTVAGARSSSPRRPRCCRSRDRWRGCAEPRCRRELAAQGARSSGHRTGRARGTTRLDAAVPATPRELAMPSGDAFARIGQLTDAGASAKRAEVITLDPAPAAAKIVETLRSWGYLPTRRREPRRHDEPAARERATAAPRTPSDRVSSTGHISRSPPTRSSPPRSANGLRPGCRAPSSAPPLDRHGQRRARRVRRHAVDRRHGHDTGDRRARPLGRLGERTRPRQRPRRQSARRRRRRVDRHQRRPAHRRVVAADPRRRRPRRVAPRRR